MGFDSAVQIGGSAALGALIAAALAWIRYWEEKPREGNDRLHEMLSLDLMALIASALVLLVPIPIGIALLGVKPLLLAIPLGLIVGVAAIVACFYGVPEGPLRRSLSEVVLLAVGLALVAAAGTTSRAWLADLVLLAVVLIATWQVPPWVRYLLEYRDTRAAIVTCRPSWQRRGPPDNPLARAAG